MGGVIRVVLASVLRATTKKIVNFFGEEKVHPRQNPGYAYDARSFCAPHCKILATRLQQQQRQQ